MPQINKSLHVATRCVHDGAIPDKETGAIMMPIFQTSTYVQQAPGQHQGYDYSRGGNPTRSALEVSLASLENANHAVTFASGLAAVQAVIQLLEPDSHVLVCDDVYGGTGRLFRKLFAKYQIEFEFVDMRDANAIKAKVRKNTKMIWMETPTNPLLHLVDIQAISVLAQQNNMLAVVDNTFASPLCQQPLALGADIVLHSSTKYIGGHSDLIGGTVMLNNDQVAEQLRFIQFAGGAVNSPFECFLLLRSIKTLALRMERHSNNALFFAEQLFNSGLFAEVIYPGLKSHPQHLLAKKQMSAFSGIVSVRLKQTNITAVTEFLSRLKVFSLAESLGGVESLVNHPETMTHASVPPEHRKKIGITTDLIRFSVGIEEKVDLVKDVLEAV